MKVERQWQLTGNASELYERVLVSPIFGPWAADLLALASLRTGERVLDVACGTGVVARRAAQQVGRAGEVTGLDLNAGMVSVARSLPLPSGAPITWVEGSAQEMRLADASFDVVLCQQGFQFFPDKAAVLREMKRVLVPGGRVLLSVWAGATPYNVALAAAVERHVGVEAATTLRSSRLGPDAEALRQLMVEAGFRDVRVSPRSLTTRLPTISEFVLQHLSASPVAAAVATLSETGRASLSEEVTLSLQAYREGDGVAFREVTNVGMATR